MIIYDLKCKKNHKFEGWFKDRTAFEEQKNEHERLLSMLSEIQRLFPTVYTVPYSPLVYEAQKRGLPISHFAPDGSAGTAYKAIADAVMTWK